MYKLLATIIATCLCLNMTSFVNLNDGKDMKLKRFESEKELKELINAHYNEFDDYYFVTNESVRDDVDFAQDSVAVSPSSSESSGATKYSDTNVQVQGVDEADIVKTNGDYIYYLVKNNLVIARAFPAENLKIVETIDLCKDSDMYGRELYINDKYIVVILNGYKSLENKNDLVSGRYSSEQLSILKIFDIDTYKLLKEVEVSGGYVSSRKIDDYIYMISNKYVYKDNIVLPLYRDTCINDDYDEIPATSIYYFDDFKECNYMMISSIDLNDLDKKVNIETLLGAGAEIYASEDSLYITRTRNVRKDENNILNNNSLMKPINRFEYVQKTEIVKFRIKDGKITYKSTGTVPGALLNQFSMDEHDEYFRIATTDSSNWEESTNNLYVLDSNLNVVGEITGLAKGEHIYSTRFMGDKCYIVTYKTVDPLFVIDLSNPKAPKVLGELKIPGYSSYLHPLGENYLIGFGEDSVEKSYKNWNGETNVTAYATGLKLAIFDVTDFNNPKEIHSIKIGGRGSSSELLNNHKALLFDEERKIFAFPATVYKEGGFYDDGTPRYGDMEFSGALVFNLSVEDGISLRGKITHNSRNYNDIKRILYIGDNLYTLSDEIIKATDINTFKDVGEAEIEVKSSSKNWYYYIN